MTLHEQLKPREIEVLRLMADGLTNREIAERLYIGFETVKWYAKQIYSKLDVSSREDAADKAQALGLLDGETQVEDEPQVKLKHNLPTQLTTFIGREQQIQAVKDLLADTRLLTLTGPGGTGKTRLSLKIAESVLNEFTQGVYFVDLAPIANSNNIPKVIASALGVIENTGEAMMETVKRSIGERALLLLIDNFEHVIDGAPIVSSMLTATTNLKVMITSREALRISGEQEYPVPPLHIHDANSEAVTLFVQRVQMVRPSFRLDDSNIDDIVRICHRVDGLPLAIELAAARCKVLTPQVLRQRLETSFMSLSGGSRDAPKRQQTLSATIDWSYNLLDEGEKQLFERLAVFCCESSLEAIESICGINLAIDVFDGLASLVDKSMIRQVEDELGEPRFVMLETIQEYAEQRLQEHNEFAALQRRHATYYMELVERAAPELRREHQEWWFTKLDMEQDNIRSAMAWALSGEDAEIGLRTVAALRDYWWYQGAHAEGWRWIEHGLEFIEDVSDKIRADIFLTGSIMARYRHNQAIVDQFAANALSIYKRLNDQQGIAWSLMMSVVNDSMQIEKRIRIIQEVLEMMRSLRDMTGQAMMLNILGMYLEIAGKHEEAWLVFEECVDVSRKTGETRREVMAIDNLGYIALAKQQTALSRQLFYKGMKLGKKLHFSYELHQQLWVCVILFLELNNIEAAFTVFGAVQSQEQLTKQLINPITLWRHKHSFEQLQATLDESPELQLAYEIGRKMSLDEAVDFALKELEG